MQSIDFSKTGVKGKLTFQTFGCNVWHEDPGTPDKRTPDVTLFRAVHSDAKIKMPDGKEIRFWGFADPKSAVALERTAPWPSPPMRVRQGQIVHVQLTTSKGPHTIHHHGIEPTTFNDGVGHVSFEVGDRYTYQWKPAHAGTFFYHCHRNTVLHFQMGMKGFLIVDPPEGPGTLFQGGPRYDVEALWMADDVDPVWHQRNEHNLGLCGEDVGFNIYNPKYFGISGVIAPNTLTDTRVAVKAALGKKILIRLLNGSYSILRTTLPVDAAVVGVDGHGLGRADAPWCTPWVIPKNQPFELTSAQRYDLLLQPPAKGTYTARLEFLNWCSRAVQNGGRGVAETRITVT